MSYYITEFDIGADFPQPHNFVKINGTSPIFELPMEYHKQPNYTQLYQWIKPFDLDLNESSFDYAFTNREFQNASETTVIINTSTGKLSMEFIRNDLFVKSENSKRKRLKPSLLILELDPKKTNRIFNLKNGSGELCTVVVKSRRSLFVIK